LDLAQLAGSDNLLEFAKVIRITQLVIDQDDLCGMFLGQREHLPATLAGRHDRLLDEHMLAGLEALGCLIGVQESGRRDDDRIDARGQQLIDASAYFCAWRELCGGVEIRLVGIEDGGDFQLREVGAQNTHVVLSERPGAEATNFHRGESFR